jgi:hypothetical protein
MEKDTHITDIVFRVEKSGDFKGTVFALFPHECSHGYMVNCYQHVGQHSSANYQGCIASSRPATPKEYADLKAEMDSLGYNIRIVKRQNYDKFLASKNEYKTV